MAYLTEPKRKTSLGRKLVRGFLNELKASVPKIIPQIIAILLAFVVGAIALLLTGYSPLEVYWAMLTGAFGDTFGIGQTLTQATPIIFTALAFLFAYKCGLFNIGAEGQLLIGAFTAALV